MFVLAARRIRTERGDADAVFTFDRLRVPRAGRAVGFRRQPAFDVPAVHRRILGFQSQFNALAQHGTLRVAVLELAADPSEAVPAPHGAVGRFAETIGSASGSKTMAPRFRRVVRFAEHENHFPRGLKSRDFTTNLWSPQSSIRSLTLAI